MSSSSAYQAAGDILSALTGGIFGLIGTHMQNQSNESMNQSNIDMQNFWNQANLNASNYWNQANIDFQNTWNTESMNRYDREFEYNKALQQQIFEREDTAIERQASSLAKLGINPLSQQLNGLGAGQAVGLPNPVSGQAPQGTPFQGVAPQKTFGMQNIIAGALEGLNAISNLNSQGIERDKLRAEEYYQRLVNESQALDNLIKANKNGISIDENGDLHINKDFRQEQDITESSYQNNEATRRRNQREDTFQNDFGAHDLMSQAGRTATDVAGITYRAEQALENTVKQSSKDVGKVVGSAIRQKLNQAKEWTKQAANNDWNNLKKAKNWLFEKVNNFGNKYLEANY